MLNVCICNRENEEECVIDVSSFIEKDNLDRLFRWVNELCF